MAFLNPRGLAVGILPILALSALLLVSLYLMGAATRNSDEFGRLYISLLVLNVIGLITLVVLIAANLARLVRQYRAGAVGSRLTVRLLAIFVTLALMPGAVVYYFSLDFIARGVDSWFDVQFERAFDDALELSRISLDERKREYLRRTNQIGSTLSFLPGNQAAITLNEMRVVNDVWLTLIAPAVTSLRSAARIRWRSCASAVRGGDASGRQGTSYVGLIGRQLRSVHPT